MEPVAIVGLSALFPGADGVEAFWENIVAGRDSITEVPPSRWLLEDHYDPDPTAQDRTYCRRGGFVPDIDFDPLEWGLPPNSLEVTDVAQLLSLVLAKRAFLDAGYGAGGREFDRERTGVVLGVGGGQKLITPLTARLQRPVWRRALETSGISGPLADLVVEKIAAAYVRWDEDSFPGLLGNVIAGRIANRFDLGGINCVVDAACAASLAALRLALAELTEHRADMMLTGGVDADNSPFMFLCFSKTPAFSRANSSRPFAESADGMLVGEGLGMLVLKRLADAERDGDRIYALIRGLGAASDGRCKSIYAPRSEGQERALRRAYAAAGVAPASIGLVEAHGTGTAAGDLCEVETLRRVLDDAAAGNRPQIALGSVKSQIGHTKAAAGAAGLIKAALALHHKVLPPTLNVDRPNPALGLDGSSLHLNVEARPWMRREPDLPRRAGVSAFGFGGTNFHVVLEEHEREQRGRYRLHGSTREILLTAETPGLLALRCAALANEVVDGAAFARLAAAAAEPVRDEAARAGFVAEDASECAELLRLAAGRIDAEPDAEEWQLARGVYYRRRAADTRGRVAALFPGQGSQYVGMGRTLALAFPPVRERIASADALCLAAGEPALSGAVFPPPAFDDSERLLQEQWLRATALAQPAIGALSAAMLDLLRACGFEPDFAAGHSFGELTALWAAGALDDETFLRLARERGLAMTVPPGIDAGSMLAVTGSVESVTDAIAGIDGVVIANLNAPDQTVIAGPTVALAEARRVLSARGCPSIELPVAAAFHTPFVAHAQAPFAEAVGSFALRTPRIPVVANATGEPYPDDPRAVAGQLAEQLVRPVRWSTQVEWLYEAGARVFVEVGPRDVLTTLVKRILGDRPHSAIALDAGRAGSTERQFRLGVIQLRVLGLRLGEIDPYRRPPATPEQDEHGAQRLRVRLNGSNYVSEKTNAAYLATLARGAVATSDEKETDVSSNGSGSHLATPTSIPGQVPSLPGTPGEIERARLVAVVEEGMAQAHTQQRELLRMQERLLTGQLELARALLEQGANMNAAAPLGAVLEAVQRQQAAAVQQHEGFIAHQAGYAEGLLGALTQLATTLLGATDAPRSGPEAADVGSIRAAARLPLPMAPLASTVEPPLASAVGASLASAVEAPPTYPAPPVQADVTISPALSSLPPASGFPPAPEIPVLPAAATTLTELQSAMLEVVSEKTGYPVATLELDMDIEADLGIDSIKRVEILGAMQARFTDLPEVKPEQLGALRTLQEVVDYLRREKTAPEHSGLGAGGADEAVVLAVPRLRTIPAPDRLEAGLPPGHCVLLTDDGSALVGSIASELSARGETTVVLRLPASLVPDPLALPAEVAELVLDGVAETEIEQALREVMRRHGPIGTFIHLHPRAEPPGFLDETQDELLRAVFLVATHLRASLMQSATLGRGSFVVVTRLDGALGTGRGESDPAGGGLYGLAKTVRHEWPAVFCRAIDLAPSLDLDAAVAAVLAELADPDERILEVAYGPDGRQTPAAEWLSAWRG